MEIHVEIDASALRQRREAMASFRRRLLVALPKAVDQGSALVLLRIKEKVSGPVLKVRTGNLRRSWQLIKAKRSADGVAGGVGTNCEYDPRHEFGFSGVEQVRAHTRILKRSARITDVPMRRSRRVRVYTTVLVRSFSRTVNYQARPHARPALAETRDAVRDKIREVVIEELTSSSGALAS